MKKQFIILSSVILGILLIISKVDAIGLVPKINSITPNPVYENDYITISGENFEDCAPSSFEERSGIYLDGVKITTYNTFSFDKKNKWTNGQIVLKVGVKGGKLKIRNCDNLTSNEVDLVVTKRKNPVLISLEPNEVYESFGYSTSPWQYITVHGTDFGNTLPDGWSMTLNGYNIGSPSSWTNTSFKIHVPSNFGVFDPYWGWDEKTKVIPGNYEFQIQLGKINNTWVYSNALTITVLDSCTQDEWDCGEWGECLYSGKKQRTCTKTFDCPSVETVSPATIQPCVYIPPYTPPACTSDTWQCGSWGTCSPQGIQTRSCSKTFDCSSAETASPATSQYCAAPNQPKQQSPTEDLGIINQDSIIKSTVKLICPVSETMASQGSGTVISSSGTILTNKHVIDGTAGCWIGFIDNYNSEPYFGDRQIADIYKISSDADVAVLKLRNPNNKILTSIDITKGNSNNLFLGDQITTYGYPAKFGTKITYTSGDFSGTDGNYLKTTAIIEHGNSGGGAYLKNGTFIGIPSAVVKGSLNSMGYLLSVNKVNSWLNNSTMAYNNDSNNNYSRVSSLLENIDLSTLASLNLFIADENEEVVDGDIIQCKNSSNPSAVYIVKIVGGVKYIRHIVSLGIFNHYKHLKWENLKQVDSLDNYSLSGWVRYNTGANGTAGPNDKVYEINGDQTKHWINMTAEQFLSHGGSEPAIFNVNKGELDLYAAGADVMSL